MKGCKIQTEMATLESGVEGLHRSLHSMHHFLYSPLDVKMEREQISVTRTGITRRREEGGSAKLKCTAKIGIRSINVQFACTKYLCFYVKTRISNNANFKFLGWTRQNSLTC